MVTLRPGQRIINIPGIGVQTSRRAVAAGGAADWWAVAGKTCEGAYAAIGAASYAASKVNLANLGIDITDGIAPAWDSTNGWKFSADSSQWLETNITPINNQAWSAIVRFSNLSGGASAFFGIIQACRFAITATVTGSGRVYQNGSYLSLSGAMITSGTMAIAGNQGYKDGVADGSTIPSAGGSFSDTIAIGQTKEAGYNFFLNGYIQAFAIYSDTLSAADVAAKHAAMAAL